MLTLKREAQVLNQGDENCNHSFLTDGFWKGLDIANKRHTQEKICFSCGQHEKVTTSIVKDNPFTFEAVVERFHNK